MFTWWCDGQAPGVPRDQSILVEHKHKLNQTIWISNLYHYEINFQAHWHLPKDFEHFMEIFLALLSNHVPSLCPPEARLAKVLDFWRVLISILPLFWRTGRFRSIPKWCITHLAWFSSARWEFNLTDICGSLKFQFCSSSLDVTLTLRVWLVSVSC